MRSKMLAGTGKSLKITMTMPGNKKVETASPKPKLSEALKTTPKNTPSTPIEDKKMEDVSVPTPKTPEPEKVGTHARKVSVKRKKAEKDLGVKADKPKKIRRRARTVLAEMKIGNSETSFQKLPLQRLIREIAQDYSQDGAIRFSTQALEYLYNICETEITTIFKKTQLLLESADRITAHPFDMVSVLKVTEDPIYRKYVDDKGTNLRTKERVQRRILSSKKVGQLADLVSK